MEAGLSCPLSTYFGLSHAYLPSGRLVADDRQAVCDYAVERIGLQYDLKNIVDLGRYLVPLPVPQRFRRRMIALGSGDPTKLICSALIARGFAAIGYPILPAMSMSKARAREGRFIAFATAHFIARETSIFLRILQLSSQRSKWASTTSRSTEQYDGSGYT